MPTKAQQVVVGNAHPYKLSIAEFALDAISKGPFDAVLPIAPETDGVLADIVAAFRKHGQRVVAPSAKTISIGTDKWKMFQHLQQNGVPTIPSWRASDVSLRIAEDGLQSPAFSERSHVVIKPKDGAGCDAIVRCRVRDLAESLASVQSADNLIVQPFIDGQAWSVGLIGPPAGQPPLVLPAARQDIDWRADAAFNRPIYRGGTIAGELPEHSQQALRRLLNRLLEIIDVEQGYVGIDLLRYVDDGEEQWLVTEINPRLCTSYVGYREAAEFNLAGFLLGICDSDRLSWSETPTPFFCEQA